MSEYWTRERLSRVVATLAQLPGTLTIIGSLRPVADDELRSDAGDLLLVTRRYEDQWETIAFARGQDEGRLLAFEDTAAESLASASQRAVVREAIARALAQPAALTRDPDDTFPFTA